jgi:cytochrome c oxidase accessory protein FixG
MRADAVPSQKPAEVPVLLYQRGARIQPRRAKGPFQRVRVAMMVLLLGAYYGLPWLSWNGVPMVWFDLPHRRFHLAGLTLAPQDLFLLAGLLFVCALSLFLVTSLAGRLWCGYACPQTVWTEAFLWIEHALEGDRHARLRLDRSGWTGEKILRRGAKHLAWLALAAFTGLTFVAYFVPARDLFSQAAQLQLGGWPLFWSVFYGFATWGNAGFMRDQVCRYMCPYARFQSAMFDRDTLVIAYDARRGEPRKSDARKLGVPAGDCTDCSLCVQVCPVGIDIRKGLQYECIACAACVDACDGVMDAIGKPQGLIRYTTASRDAGQKLKLLRPRTIAYGGVWLAACAALGVLLLMHQPVRFDVLRDRHTLVRERADGSLENLYVFKLTSGDDVAHRFDVEASLVDGSPLRTSPASVSIAPGVTQAVPVILRTRPDVAGASEADAVWKVRIRLVEQGGDITLEREARFLALDPRAD